MANLIEVEPQVYHSCTHCICSVCHIAESNGGAPGCGNCEECKGEDPVSDCNEFYATWRYLRYCNRNREGEHQ